MTGITGGKKIYSIPAGIPFAKTLAVSLFKDAEATDRPLSTYKILLPTRRACRTVREAFLRHTNGRALLLPALQAIGDIDEEELSLSLAGHNEDIVSIPPAIHPLKRQILLARTIHKIRNLVVILIRPWRWPKRFRISSIKSTPKAFASKTFINWCRKNSRSTGKSRSIFF